MQDSVRLRRRLSAYVQDNFPSADVANALRRRLGVEVKVTGVPSGLYYHISDYFVGAEWYDVLDAVSVIADIRKLATDQKQVWKRISWIHFASSAFLEDNVAFRVDCEGVVQPLIDDEFMNNMASAIAALDDPRFASVRRDVEAALADLDTIPQRSKHAVRAIFDDVEPYVKLAFHGQKIPRLGAAIVNGKVVPAIRSKLGSDAAAEAAIGRMGAVLVDWTAAAHNYRHGQKTTEPTDPPLEVATVLVSTGAALLRWLVQGTAHLLPPPPAD